MKLLRIALLWIPRLIDRRTERFQSDLVNRHYEEAENMYRVMRSWRHGYRNHLQTAVSWPLPGSSRPALP